MTQKHKCVGTDMMVEVEGYRNAHTKDTVVSFSGNVRLLNRGGCRSGVCFVC